ncbi:PiggyBac transposable element-derived protein 4 [Cucumispora dikerogammari]|nr:PiggyBac transposable element-derived protein 4 [Cucumispora dikerogammari]
MKYSKFSLIISNITCISEEDYVEGGRKIVNEPKIISFINKRFKCSHKPKDFLSIDESTILFKGIVAFKVFNPRKPDKYGIKVYMCSDSKNEYIYFTKICSISFKIRNTVFSLFGGFEYKWHKVFIGNFYNSYALFEKILK